VTVTTVESKVQKFRQSTTISRNRKTRPSATSTEALDFVARLSEILDRCDFFTVVMPAEWSLV
jgi:hypothetical protein